MNRTREAAVSALSQRIARENAAREAPTQEAPATTPMTLYHPPKNVHRVFAAVMWFFLGGMLEASPGALLPNIESHYRVLYLVVSLVWAGYALGGITAAVLLAPLQRQVGRFWILVIGIWIQFAGGALVATAAAFPVTILGFYLLGIGYALVLSQFNVMLSRMDNPCKYLGYLHGMYGLGASVAPFVAQQMLNLGLKWLRFYLVATGYTAVTLAAVWAAFRGCDEDFQPWDQDIPLQDLGGEPAPLQPRSETESVFAALRTSKMWLIALFIFFYQGGEMSLSGWIVTFLIDARHANPATIRYAASGFWFGLTVGRVSFTPVVGRWVGARRGVILLAVASVFLVGLGWAIPNSTATAVLVALAGVCSGPLYLLQVVMATRHLPRRSQVVALTIITAFGFSGDALFPVLVGVVSQHSGSFVVMPVYMALFLAMLVCWFLLPNLDRNVKTRWWHHIW